MAVSGTMSKDHNEPDYLPPAPKPGLKPMPVDDTVIAIANLMKPV